MSRKIEKIDRYLQGIAPPEHASDRHRQQLRQQILREIERRQTGCEEWKQAHPEAVEMLISRARRAPLASASPLKIRSTIMRSPIAKLAAAAVIAVVVLGIFELVGTDSSSGVVWAEVAEKVKASRGVIFRQKATCTKYPGGGSGHSMIFISPTHRRSDGYNKDGQIWISMYGDIDAGTGVVVLHNRKGYVHETLSEGNLQEQAGWVDPKAWVNKFLSCEYTKLGQKTIEGIVCEGIETMDPALNPEAADHLQIDRFVARLWVSVETGYPVLLASEFTGKYNGESVMDQFQWDVDLDASIFEPNIPPDYEQL